MAKLKAIKNKVVLDDGADDPEFLACMKYVQMVEMEGKEKQEYGAAMGISPATTWQWQIRWEQSGLIAKIRRVFGSVIADDATVANRKAIRQWDKLATEMIHLAMEARSEFVRMQSIAWTYEHLVEPFLREQEDPSGPARDYRLMIEANPRMLNPLSVAEDNSADDLEPDSPAPTDVPSTSASY